ncbi:oxysterol-binding protein-related protein 6-like [Garra rufa]|uniref:oxysterol-binding protein-related protein 6-like n=1 Tax=Garra rufa TaxID=137080 RepID=UPI003CCE6309
MKPSTSVSEGNDSQEKKSRKSSFETKGSAGQAQQVQDQTMAAEDERSADGESINSSTLSIKISTAHNQSLLRDNCAVADDGLQDPRSNQQNILTRYKVSRMLGEGSAWRTALSLLILHLLVSHGKPATVWSLGVVLFVMLCGHFPKKKDLLEIVRDKWFEPDLSDVNSSLKSIHESLALERERVRQAWAGPDLRQSTSDQLATLCTTLSELEMQSRLTRVHSVSLSSDSSDESYCTVRQDQPSPSQEHKLYRTPSVTDSTAEYFDASEVVCENLFENETSDESGLSDVTTSNSEPEEGLKAANMKYRASVSSTNDLPSNALVTGRRTVLPAHSSDNSHIGILTILYNNIGKDLSRVSMPVALNEPLSLLQRVSEELEYSELLDIANHTDDPFERMVYVAAFSISGYAWASWRNRYKPFNPVLGETFENVREDRGFRYIAEQVSHHPPLSACHAESDNFSFWQDQRWKYKFWGKSVEIVSSGMVNVTLPKYGDHYEWNKAVTCIHNVFTQQRWLEHYGDVVIRNLNNDECTCKITFVKSRYWGDDNSKNEVQGTVLDRTGKVLHRFGGSWHEGIFCDTFPEPQCIWKPNPQPNDYFDYYGFSQYARELNELTPDIKEKLPPTDTRFRPDQRLLEEGKVEEADKRKDEIEEKQRERRKTMTKRSEEHVPRFFVKTLDHAGREVWVTNGTYWKIRENPGFANTENLDLWC